MVRKFKKAVKEIKKSNYFKQFGTKKRKDNPVKHLRIKHSRTAFDNEKPNVTDSRRGSLHTFTKKLFEKHLKPRIDSVISQYRRANTKNSFDGNYSSIFKAFIEIFIMKIFDYSQRKINVNLLLSIVLNNYDTNEEIKEEISAKEESLNTSYYTNTVRMDTLKLERGIRGRKAMKRKKFGLDNKPN